MSEMFTIPCNAWLNGWPVIQFNLEFAIDSPASLQARLGVGYGRDGSLEEISVREGDEVLFTVGSDIVPYSSRTTYDASAQFLGIYPQQTIFRGTVTRISTVVAYGNVSLTIDAVGRLADVDAVVLDKVLPNSGYDEDARMQFGTDGSMSGNGLQVSESVDDLWYGLYQYLTRSTSGSYEVLNEIYPADLSSGVYLKWRTFLNERMLPGILSAICTRLANNDAGHTALTLIQDLGNQLGFKLIESGSVMRLVPWVGVFDRSIAYTIAANTYSTIPATMNRVSPNVRRLELYLPLEVSGVGSDNDGLLIGSWTDQSIGAAGRTITAQIPPLLREASENFVGEDEFGDRDFTLSPSDDVNRLAKFQLFQSTLQRSGAIVQCPYIRGDVGLLRPVKVEYPNNRAVNAATDTPAVFGVVTKIEMSADFSNTASPQASTTLHVAYLRSNLRQGEIERGGLTSREHPYFTETYRGHRLDAENE